MHSGHPVIICSATVVVLILFISTTNALLLPSFAVVTKKTLSQRFRISTHLNYRDNGQGDSDDQLKRKAASSKKLSIPVLGPIPGAIPLIVGGDMYLDPPTPMQWLTLEESILAFQQQNNTEINHPTVGATATIDASPLVAILHDSTAGVDGSRSGARYATLAAVVGMSTSRSNVVTDSADVMETIRAASSKTNQQQLLPSSSRIRLVGVGRALLHEFFYRISLTDMEDGDHEHEDDEDHNRRTRMSHEEEEDDEIHRKTPIIVASFQLLADDGILTPPKASKYGVSSRFSSPVHALARMSSAANRLIRLHDDRRRLVRGLQAAKTRLEYVTSNRRNEWIMEEDDYDGLGLISSSVLSSASSSDEVDDEEGEQQSDIDNLLHTFPPGVLPPAGEYHSLGMLSRSLLEKENYGLGFSAASLSSIAALTKALLEKLEPYYTAEKVATEEFYYEALSFCAMRSLESYLVQTTSHSDYWSWGLTCTNTVERLEQVHEWMWQHKHELEMLAKQASQDLRDCGEECTDLW